MAGDISTLSQQPVVDSQRRHSGTRPLRIGRRLQEEEEEEEQRTKVDSLTLVILQVLAQTEVRRISTTPHHDRLRD